MMSRSFLTIHLARLHIVCLLLSVGCCVLGFSGVKAQEPPTVTVTSFSGQVMVSLQGQAPRVAAVGDVLRAGDVMTTLVGAEAVLTFSEDSELHLGEKTKIDIATLTQSRGGARKSNVKLQNGRVRAFLSPGQQKDDSTFTVETPNATAGVKFSHPDVEITYDSEIRKTVILAYTVSVAVRNLVTKEFTSMPPDHQAVVQDEFLWISPIMPDTANIPIDEQNRQTQAAMLRQSQHIMGGAVSPAPSSFGTATSQGSGLGPAGGSSSQTKTVTIITEEEP